ncbi:MAG: cytochrome oxidase small assembly protein [Gammaproteobacteria bacterium]
MVDDGQDDEKRRRSKRNIRTALVLAAIALLFYIGFVLKTMMT